MLFIESYVIYRNVIYIRIYMYKILLKYIIKNIFK